MKKSNLKLLLYMEKIISNLYFRMKNSPQIKDFRIVKKISENER